ATDVTGFGLLGHLAKMAEASGVDVAVDASAVPLLPDVAALAAAGAVPAGTGRNLGWVRDRLTMAGSPGPDGPDDPTLVLLADAQTSGWLLFGSSAAAASAAVAELRAGGHRAAVIGSVTGPGAGRITVR
ncbi:MAG: AIR synthase-related protein, partial [Acidimicrobiales bacterium]